MPKKKQKRGTFWIFQHPFCRKLRKNRKGDPLGIFFPEKISHNAEKTQKKNLFDSVRLSKWFNLTPYNFVEFIELFRSLQVYRKKFKNH